MKMRSRSAINQKQTKTMRLQFERWASPMGALLIVTDEEGVLRALEFREHESRMERLLREHYPDHLLEQGKTPASVMNALRDYFEGRLEAVNDLRTATGGTPFQREVWKALRAI